MRYPHSVATEIQYRWLCTALCFIAVPASIAATEPPIRVQTRAPYAASVTLVPPGPVTDHAEVEVRVAVRNHSRQPEEFDIVVTVCDATNKSHRVFETSIEVAARAQRLTAVRFAAQKFIGMNHVRCRVTGGANFESRDDWPLEVIACNTRALPLVQFGWIDPGAIPSLPSAADSTKSPPAMGEKVLRAAIDHYHRVGINGLIITYPEYICSGGGPYYPSRVFAEYPRQASFDIVGTILNQASKNGQHVFVGIGRGRDELLTWTGMDDRDRIAAALRMSRQAATELWQLYGDEPSFYGWYLTHEANDIAHASRVYYNPMVEFLHTFEADKPVLVSPAGTPILSREILANSKVDIFAYQDAVGAGYVPYQYTFDPQRRISVLEDLYKAYAAAHRGSGKHLWANLEIWQMDGPRYEQAYAADFSRVRRQLEIASRNVDVVTAYQLIGYMNPPNIQTAVGGERARDLFNSYRDYYQSAAHPTNRQTSETVK